MKLPVVAAASHVHACIEDIDTGYEFNTIFQFDLCSASSFNHVECPKTEAVSGIVYALDAAHTSGRY